MKFDDSIKPHIISILLTATLIILLSSIYLDTFQQAVLAYGFLIFSCLIVRIKKQNEF